jgi:hypothetical protein
LLRNSSCITNDSSIQPWNAKGVDGLNMGISCQFGDSKETGVLKLCVSSCEVRLRFSSCSISCHQLHWTLTDFTSFPSKGTLGSRESRSIWRIKPSAETGKLCARALDHQALYVWFELWAIIFLGARGSYTISLVLR